MSFSKEKYEKLIDILLERNKFLEESVDLLNSQIEHSAISYSHDEIPNNRPQSEISKLKLFMEIFNALSSKYDNLVNKQTFINELVQTGRFTVDDSCKFIKKAMSNGQIYENRSGSYSKT